MYVSAVILTHNSEASVAPCLDSLASAFKELPSPNEIFVIDNGSTDGTRRILSNYLSTSEPVVHITLLDENRGTTVARNLALRQVRGDFVLVVDSDVVVQPGTLGALIAHLNDNPNTGLVAPRLVFPDGRPQLSTDRFPTVWHKIKRALFLRSMERRMGSTKPPVGLQLVDYAISAFWLLPRRTLDKVGLLDERFFYAPEDVDYCLSIWMAGRSVDLYPAVTAVHHAAELTRTLRPSGLLLHHLSGLARYFIKWRYGLSRRRLYARIDQTRHSAGLRAKPVSTPET